MDVDAAAAFVAANNETLVQQGASYAFLLPPEASSADADYLLSEPVFANVVNVVVLVGGHDEKVVLEKQLCGGTMQINLWRQETGFMKDGLFNDRILSDMSCRLVTAATFNYPPFIYVNEGEENGTKEFSGVEVRLKM